ncbi:MAG: stage II sporulation protein M [Chloroflexota bacterium]|nr:stage II sporulation protein M [Anaerolineae bacterium]
MTSLSRNARGRPALAGAGRMLSNALIVTRREVRDSFRDWRIMGPIFLLTLVFPLLANGMTNLFISFFEANGAEPLLPAMLPLLPMIVGFFPVSISLVIALETFVGEKERLSLEPLLATPLTNTELYLGKSFAAMLPPLLASYIGIAIYMGGLVFGGTQWRPAPALVIQILLLTSVQALVMVTGAVVISSQTTSTRAANLLASFIIIPMSMLVILESLIMIQPHRRFVLWFLAAGLLVTVALLVRMGARIFNREELLGRSLDQLNLRWIGRTFASQFRGVPGKRSPLRWYRASVTPAVRALGAPAAVTGLCLAAAFAGGWLAAGSWPLPLDQFESNDAHLLENLRSWFELGRNNPGLVLAAVSQNLRVLALATLLAVFSFGTMALVLVMIPFGITGFILAQVAAGGLSPLPFFAAIVPHGVVEIPAIVLAGAAALRLGSVITRPPAGMTVGEAWIRALADTVKIGVAVVLPLIVVAGILEVTLTPRIVEFVLAR